VFAGLVGTKLFVSAGAFSPGADGMPAFGAELVEVGGVGSECFLQPATANKASEETTRIMIFLFMVRAC
jgi:hypothetical protein